MAGSWSSARRFPDASPRGKDEKEALENIREAIIAWLWAEDQKAMSKRKKKLKETPVVVAV